MDTVELTTLCRIYDPATDRVLIEHRAKSWKGVAFPGGHVEPDESVVAAVIREVREETGLTLLSPRLCGIVHWVNVDTHVRTLIHYFDADRFEGTLSAGTDEGRIEWVTQSALRTLPLAPNFDTQLRLFDTLDLSECFFRYRNNAIDGRAEVLSVELR